MESVNEEGENRREIRRRYREHSQTKIWRRKERKTRVAWEADKVLVGVLQPRQEASSNGDVLVISIRM